MNPPVGGGILVEGICYHSSVEFVVVSTEAGFKNVKPKICGARCSNQVARRLYPVDLILDEILVSRVMDQLDSIAVLIDQNQARTERNDLI